MKKINYLNAEQITRKSISVFIKSVVASTLFSLSGVLCAQETNKTVLDYVELLSKRINYLCSFKGSESLYFAKAFPGGGAYYDPEEGVLISCSDHNYNPHDVPTFGKVALVAEGWCKEITDSKYGVGQYSICRLPNHLPKQ